MRFFLTQIWSFLTQIFRRTQIYPFFEVFELILDVFKSILKVFKPILEVFTLILDIFTLIPGILKLILDVRELIFAKIYRINIDFNNLGQKGYIWVRRKTCIKKDQICIKTTIMRNMYYHFLWPGLARPFVISGSGAERAAENRLGSSEPSRAEPANLTLDRCTG